jgi:hypothetical protein
VIVTGPAPLLEFVMTSWAVSPGCPTRAVVGNTGAIPN